MNKKAPTYSTLFFKREMAALQAPGRRGLWLLAALYFLLLLPLAFALGGLETLRQRMEDPFTQQVEVQLPTGTSAQAIIDYFTDQKRMTELGISGIELNGIRHHFFRDPDKPFADKYRCLAFDAQSRIWQQIRADKGLLLREVSGGIPEHPDDQCGVIVTSGFLRSLGLDPSSAERVIWQSGTGMQDGSDYHLILPVFAVVSRLPGDCPVAMTIPMAERLENPESSGFAESQAVNDRFLLLIEATERSEVFGALRKVMRSGLDPNDMVLESSKLDKTRTIWRADLPWSEQLDLDKRRAEIARINNLPDVNLTPLLSFRTFCSGTPEKVNRYYLNFFFDRLDKVEEFNEILDQQFELRLELAKVKSSQNFALVARLTGILASLLFLFSLAGLVFYLVQTVRQHLERNRRGLGTLAAFGLPAPALARVYRSILLRFNLQASAIAVVTGAILQFMLHLFTEQSFLQFLHPAVLLVMPLCWATIIWTVQHRIKHHLRRSPGDLVYNR